MNRRASAVTAAAFVVGAGVDVLVGSEHLPGYSAAIGLVGCVLIVLVSKWLGKAFVQRPEEHYPRDVPADAQEDLRGR